MVYDQVEPGPGPGLTTFRRRNALSRYRPEGALRRALEVARRLGARRWCLHWVFALGGAAQITE